MGHNKYPFRYFLYLALALLMVILFWFFIFRTKGNSNLLPKRNNASIGRNLGEIDHVNNSYLPDNNAQIITIDTSKIISDSLNYRRIISNIVNIAIKNSHSSILTFASELKKKYPQESYKIIYIDTVINRLQLELPDNDRNLFKKEVKVKMNAFNLLVWDEILFDYSKDFNDPKLKDKDANWYLRAIDIDREWNKTIGNKDVVIAVIDNGFDLNHPELIGNAVKPYNVIDKTTNVSPSKENHGTHVASTIVAKGNNNEGIVGICSGCSIMPIKVEDDNGNMSNSYIIDAILYAIKNKADVINLSLGMYIPDNVNIPLQAQKDYINSSAKDEEGFWDDLFDYADKNNVTCVLAAGNSDILTGFDPFQRAKNTIKVGAIDREFNRAKFSNYGDNTTIYAPGTNIFGAKPHDGYEFLNGTSMSAPIVSGFIGLLKSQNKKLSNEQILKLLNTNSIQLNNLKILDAKN